MNFKCYPYGLITILIFNSLFCKAQDIVINNNLSEKVIVFGNSKILITLDYNAKCNISELLLNGQSVICGPAGIFSSVKTSNAENSTLNLKTNPIIRTGKNSVTVSNIKYGNNTEMVEEVWNFLITENNIRFEIERDFPNSLIIEEAAFPSFRFKSINTWDGAFTGYGGLAWFYLFNQKLCTYGVHSDCSVFWNSFTGNALKVAVSVKGKQVAMKYSRSDEDNLIYNIVVSDNEQTYRYDSEKRSRFIRGKNRCLGLLYCSGRKICSDNYTFISEL